MHASNVSFSAPPSVPDMSSLDRGDAGGKAGPSTYHAGRRPCYTPGEVQLGLQEPPPPSIPILQICMQIGIWQDILREI